MRIISRKTLRLFWEKPEFFDAEQSFKAWFREALNADWSSPAAVKAAFATASIVANNRTFVSLGPTANMIASTWKRFEHEDQAN